MATTATLQDDFLWGTIDTTKWDPAAGADSTQVTEPNLFLNITHTAASQYNTLQAATTYNLTGSYAFVQLLNAGNQAITSHEAILGISLDANNAVWITVSGNLVSAYKKVASVQTQIGASIAYSSTTHAWLRIIESGGTISFDTSVDGSNWTNRWTLANPFAVTAIKPYLQSGCWQAEASGSFANFSNFNLTTGQLQFSWMGYTWNKRIQNGPSMYNNNWTSANVTGPDGSNYVTVSVSNAGSAPIGGEFFSSKRGWGYGTYVWVIGTQANTIDSRIVIGGMFTFDFTRPPDYAEIDMGEARNYNAQPNIQILYSHTWNSGGVDTFITDNIDVSADVVRTYKCVWTPTKLSFTSYAGTGTAGTVLEHYDHETHIPSTSLERIHFNMWVQNINTPASAPATSAVLRQFFFDPRSGMRHVSVGDGMGRSEGAT